MFLFAFEILEDGEPAPSNYKKSSGHWKARWVKDGHKTADPVTSNYAGVVSCECSNCSNLCCP
jgi:hypothetical protein